MTERIVAAGATQLWSEDHGDPGDPPVLLISGDCQPALFWPEEVVAALVGGGFHVIRYDHRDTGRSTHRDFAANPCTFDDLTADAIAVLDAWDVGAAHVIAFSMGAGLAQLIAVDHPHRMLSQTLICTHALGIDFADNVARALAGEPSKNGLPLPEPRVFEALELHAGPTQDRSAELDRRVAAWRRVSGEDFDPAEFRRREERAIDHAGTLHQSLANGYVTEGIATRGADLARITAPTLVVQAPLDPISPPPHGRHLAESVPGAALVEIPGMGHALTDAAIDSLMPTVLAHLRR